MTEPDFEPDDEPEVPGDNGEADELDEATGPEVDDDEPEDLPADLDEPPDFDDGSATTKLGT